MKTFQFLHFWFLFMSLAIFSQNNVNIEVHNPSHLEQKSTLIAIQWTEILNKFPKIDTTQFVVIDSQSRIELPFQLEHKGQANIQNLLIQVNVKPNSSLKIQIKKGKPKVIEAKTFARYVPERKDDFAWENDLIAFRTYGKALENTKENAYGLDVWVKNTSKMIINERYKRGDYHLNHGNGLDYYHVGFTLGAGNIAPFVKDTIRYSANYRQWKILDNGPLRSTFKLEYDSWNAGGRTVSLTKTISLDAGSQLSKIENSFQFADTINLPVVVGIVKRPDKGIMYCNEQKGILSYWEPSHPKHGTTGIGVILVSSKTKMESDKLHLLAKTEVKNLEPLIYYSGAVWDKANQIKQNLDWLSYLENFYDKLQNPLQVIVK